MTFDEFHAAARPLITPDRDEPTFWACGLAGEVGEVMEVAFELIALSIAGGALANTAKKIERDGASTELDSKLVSESGDVLFYVRQVLERRGLNMQDAANACLVKLANQDAKIKAAKA